ncbi:hypothetical protein DSL92_08525 [Billgrantia gudaonensis]|uniref:Uncharacterized protein n=1 Tax=Billgrantia gudaonensis TaxID=376427 RepID=A0A3S0QR93_9GAMM|nr:hypothetical protein DSL92_08525 [Halomonas gudaonensis]
MNAIRPVDLEGVGDLLKSGSRRMGASMQLPRFRPNRSQTARERKREGAEEKACLAEEREAVAQAERKAQAEREAVAARRRCIEEARLCPAALTMPTIQKNLPCRVGKRRGWGR